jgi:UDP-N-acetyl-D-glucosamine dehydrogenase
MRFARWLAHDKSCHQPILRQSQSSLVSYGIYMMLTKVNPEISLLRDRLSQRRATVGVCGMGYVGLPLAAAAAKAGHGVIGFDIDEAKIELLNRGQSYIDAVKSHDLADFIAQGLFKASSDFTELAHCDVIVVCVPTPLSKQREPDLTFVETTSRTIAKNLRKGQLVIVESTTYPGTTEDVVKPLLEAGGLKSGTDFLLGFSPEREDPGNKEFGTASIPKIIAGDGEIATALMHEFYGSFVARIVPVSTTQTAEAVKLTENIFRAVNIALVNELKVIYSAMGIDIWEVIEAAKTKPFGFMPFYPGPGLGGHCIPIDPFYLTWKSREFELPTRFVELAGEINLSMPHYVVEKLALALDQHAGLALGRSKVLIIGVAYKRNVADIRESPSLKLMELLEARGTAVAYHDPHVPEIPKTRQYGFLKGIKSVHVDEDTISRYDAVLIATDHDDIDYGLIGRAAKLVVDTRNVMARNKIDAQQLVKA